MNYFVYKGIRSCDLGLRIEKKDVFSAPKYDMDFLAIPGRDGDLIAGAGRFPNVQITYTVFVVAKSVSELYDHLALVKNWLYTDMDTYHVLSDTYDTLCYRHGVFCGKLDNCTSKSFKNQPNALPVSTDIVSFQHQWFFKRNLLKPYETVSLLSTVATKKSLLSSDKGDFFNDTRFLQNG